MTKIAIRPDEIYELHFADKDIKLSGYDIETAIDIDSMFKVGHTMTQLKDAYVSLSRAVEEGNDLRLGIVIGQVLAKLNDIINEAN